ncbi:MAG: hypothetical protein AVDCRST_MAG25-570 [uncultured Rubrobacteraceae bacterium]|uniref:Uncharacterized protein n=1 Tax=uncultured Rubrobacteraceae bacterium TaxID=349277 RepID=A0A6J4QYL7_9ACTN|nr:MAG: hypothetical protein AVDCRST_MAG25-570 [uncultured Rubrobacteraceae bacterium]
MRPGCGNPPLPWQVLLRGEVRNRHAPRRYGLLAHYTEAPPLEEGADDARLGKDPSEAPPPRRLLGRLVEPPADAAANSVLAWEDKRRPLPVPGSAYIRNLTNIEGNFPLIHAGCGQEKRKGRSCCIRVFNEAGGLGRSVPAPRYARERATSGLAVTRRTSCGSLLCGAPIFSVRTPNCALLPGLETRPFSCGRFKASRSRALRASKAPRSATKALRRGGTGTGPDRRDRFGAA